MTITSACCCLCGRSVIDDGGQPQWMARFYAVYYLHDDRNKWYVSGLGQRLQFEDRVNVDDITDKRPLKINLNPLVIYPSSTPLPQPNLSPNASGYSFHAACWGLFSASGSTETSDILLLANLCRSTPIKHGLMHWGHDYGGILDISAHDVGGALEAQTKRAPGEEPQLFRFPAPLNSGPDPWDIPGLARLFNRPTYLPTSAPLPAGILLSEVLPRERGQEDPFQKLPEEVLCMILVYLPSVDVARLRLASPAFANTPLTDDFWRSRFGPQREFHHVFEAHQSSKLHRGRWRSIFAAVKCLETTDAMLERRRIWDLGLSLHGILRMMRDIKCEGTPIQTICEPHAPSESSNTVWVTASRALIGQHTCTSDIFSLGSRSLFERKLKMPPQNQKIALFVSIVDLFGRRHISGIRILDSNKESRSLGYVNRKSETLVSQMDSQQFIGFCLAQDQRGVRGLAMMSKGGSMSPWVGDHHDFPKRQLLTQNVGMEPVDSLKGGFDVCDNLINTALWYPQIPNTRLRFLGMTSSVTERNQPEDLPICYTIFGGSSGENLDGISGLTVRGHDETGEGFLSIAVDFTDPNRRVVFGSNKTRSSEEWPFVIHGSRGERITGVDIFRSLTGLKVSLESTSAAASSVVSGKLCLTFDGRT
ncbi:hypothetical protein B0I35DRAFT_349090 [Stachybotrys elegans]|uniref:F-box domain-containing protein n=1 Tax=Stachybotrys elegans TaxID=80388 RepID=A0A8K0T1I0_9HYPO|nr:hypothetical protein B0I35DRAFT_349090 [Stachybotrys elegans]